MKLDLPTFDLNNYELDDCLQIHEQYPDTFNIPSLEDKQNLKPGDRVKLIFRMHQQNSNELSVERMWVEIDEIKGDYFIGFLDNDPYGDVFIEAGEGVVFQGKHIMQIYTDESSSELYDLADSFIKLANSHGKTIDKTNVSASLSFTATRYNVFMAALGTENKDDFVNRKDEIVDYFMMQFREMLTENIDVFTENYEKFIQ